MELDEPVLKVIKKSFEEYLAQDANLLQVTTIKNRKKNHVINCFNNFIPKIIEEFKTRNGARRENFYKDIKNSIKILNLIKNELETLINTLKGEGSEGQSDLLTFNAIKITTFMIENFATLENKVSPDNATVYKLDEQAAGKFILVLIESIAETEKNRLLSDQQSWMQYCYNKVTSNTTNHVVLSELLILCLTEFQVTAQTRGNNKDSETLARIESLKYNMHDKAVVDLQLLNKLDPIILKTKSKQANLLHELKANKPVKVEERKNLLPLNLSFKASNIVSPVTITYAKICAGRASQSEVSEEKNGGKSPELLKLK